MNQPTEIVLSGPNVQTTHEDGTVETAVVASPGTGMHASNIHHLPGREQEWLARDIFSTPYAVVLS